MGEEARLVLLFLTGIGILVSASFTVAEFLVLVGFLKKED